MTRAQHLAWAKARALDVLETGTVEEAFTSLTSDLQKHPALELHAGIGLGVLEFLAGRLSTKAAMRTYIEGCQ